MGGKIFARTSEPQVTLHRVVLEGSTAKPSTDRQVLTSWLMSATNLHSERLCPLRTIYLLGKEFLQCVGDLKIGVPQARAELLFQFLHKFFKLLGTNL